jgi:UDP-N-acetyl-D-mannosaminuronic acid dehydrogenase
MNVYIYGLGHVGLPMAVWMALSGQKVIGIDSKREHLEKIKKGAVEIHEYYKGIHIAKLAQNMIESGKLCILDKLERTVFEPAIFIVSVGFNISKENKLDFSPLQNVLDNILPQLTADDLLLFRTTMIPGTCENLIIPKLRNLRFPVSFAYCPETIAETHAFEELDKNPLILAAIDEESMKKAEAFWRSLSDAPIYKASNLRTAEMVKVIQNIDRDVNIALINEISEVAEKLAIDVTELRALVNTHPRVNLLQPGPGVGGYCIPHALRYLEAALPDKDLDLNIMRTARENNNQRPYHVVKLIQKALRDADKLLQNATIALFGLAMKDDCADYRFSPAITITEKLLNLGAKVKAFDPLVPPVYHFQVGSFSESIQLADCFVITAIHKGFRFDIGELRANMNQPLVVVDTRNVFPYHDDVRLYKM